MTHDPWVKFDAVGRRALQREFPRIGEQGGGAYFANWAAQLGDAGSMQIREAFLGGRAVRV